jgi:signal transduction histidine kinase
VLLQYSPLGRVERLVAAGRVVLAAFSLVAIWLDPSEPAQYAPTAYAVLAVYVGYAVLVALAVWRASVVTSHQQLAMHGFDLGVFTVLMYFTEGPTSPFFVYFVFSLLCATLRWHVRGTLWTALAALALFVGMGFYAAEILGDPAFQLNRFIMRSVYLAVVAALLGYLGAHEARMRRELGELAAWSRTMPAEAQALVCQILERTAAVLGTPRAALAWEEPEEPWLHVAVWSRGDFRWTREPPGLFEPVVAGALAPVAFLCRDTRAPRPSVLHRSPAGVARWNGEPIHRGLQARLDVGAVLALPVNGEGFAGRVFGLDKPEMTSDDLLLGEIVARQVALDLGNFYLLQRMQRSAASDERIRLARDLHDGLLQSLTGVALELQAARRLLDEDPESVRARLVEIQTLIAIEQAALRAFVQTGPAPGSADAPGLPARLEALSDRLGRQWGLRVELKWCGTEPRLPEAFAQDTYLIVHEALVNAARHAQARLVSAEIAADDGAVRITVADDGRGFPFRGRYDQAALAAMESGPVSLRKRVAALGGSLSLDSSDAGTRLDIRLPVTPAERVDAH